MLTSFCPVICTSRPVESRAFYSRLFGFTATHPTEWYADLGRPGGTTKSPSSTTVIPHCPRRSARRCARCGSPWRSTTGRGVGATGRLGARRSPDGGHLVVKDPNGVWIDVVAPN